MKRNQRVLSLILSLILIAGSAVTPTWAAEAAIPNGSATGSFIESENASAETLVGSGVETASPESTAPDAISADIAIGAEAARAGAGNADIAIGTEAARTAAGTDTANGAAAAAIGAEAARTGAGADTANGNAGTAADADAAIVSGDAGTDAAATAPGAADIADTGDTDASNEAEAIPADDSLEAADLPEEELLGEDELGAAPTATPKLTATPKPTATATLSPTPIPTSGTWNGLKWALTYENTRLTVVGSGEMPDCAKAPWHAPEIRDNITTVCVGNYMKSVGPNAFSNFTNLKTITLGQRITYIGKKAFEYCEDLRTINNTSSVLTRIEENAFAGCENLSEPLLPESLLEIDDHAFADCYGLRRVLLPDGMESIGDEVFANDVGINHIKVPGTVMDVGYNIFKNCVGPMSAEVDSYIVGEGMFRDCSGLQSVTFGSDVAAIGRYAFQNCIGLTSIEIPEGMTVIGDSAFEGCRELKTVNFQKGVSTICTRAFYGCGLESVTLPETVTTLSSYTFSMCEELKTVDLSATQISTVADYTFAKDLELTSINFSESILSIGQYAFDHCTKLESVTLPNKVETIGKSAFAYNSALKEFIPSDVLTEIGDNAFYYCMNLENVMLGSKMKTLGANAFAFCLNLTNLTVKSMNMEYKGKYVLRNTPVTLCSYKGSTTETYAAERNFAFIVIEGLPAPVITTCARARACVSLKWNEVPNATTYIVYRSLKSRGTYSRIATTKELSLLDKKVETGKTYYYYIIAYDGTSRSEASDIANVTFVASPASVSLVNVYKGSRLTWAPVPNAEYYLIYRKTDGNFSRIKTIQAPTDTSTNITFIDEKAVHGTTYTYAVFTRARGVNSVRRESRACMRLSTPISKTISSPSKGTVVITWNKVPNVRGYQVKVSTDKNFKKDVQTVVAGGGNTVKKEIHGLKSGTTYYMRVLCYQKTTQYYYSGTSSVKTIKVK